MVHTGTSYTIKRSMRKLFSYFKTCQSTIKPTIVKDRTCTHALFSLENQNQNDKHLPWKEAAYAFVDSAFFSMPFCCKAPVWKGTISTNMEFWSKKQHFFDFIWLIHTKVKSFPPWPLDYTIWNMFSNNQL